MDNVFQKSKREASLDYSKQVNEKRLQQQRLREIKNEQASLDVRNRYNQYIQSDKVDDNMKRSMDEGSIKLLHINHHCFRDRVKNQEKDKLGGIYLQTQLNSNDRAQLCQTEFIKGHLEKDEFRADLPTKSIKKWLRVREMAHEGPEMRFGLKERTENENIQKNINEHVTLDHTERNMKMVNFPEWKHNLKNRWRRDSEGNIKDFYTATNNFSTDKAPWQQTPILLDKHEPYIDGMDAIGEQQTSRNRIKDKEWGRPDFIPTVKGDTWEDTLKTSKSIRTLKGDQTFQVPQDIDLFSTNQKLDTEYRKVLLETKSIDRQVPFRHSQNINGLELNDLRPNTDKIYKLSLIHHNLVQGTFQKNNSPIMGNTHQMHNDQILENLENEFNTSRQITPNKKEEKFYASQKSIGNNSTQQNTMAMKRSQESPGKDLSKTMQNNNNNNKHGLKGPSQFSQTVNFSKNQLRINSPIQEQKSHFESVQSGISPENSPLKKNPLYRNQSTLQLRKKNNSTLPQLHTPSAKDYLPWEQPSKEEISQMVGKYFVKKQRPMRKKNTLIKINA